METKIFFNHLAGVLDEISKELENAIILNNWALVSEQILTLKEGAQFFNEKANNE